MTQTICHINQTINANVSTNTEFETEAISITTIVFDLKTRTLLMTFKQRLCFLSGEARMTNLSSVIILCGTVYGSPTFFLSLC